MKQKGSKKKFSFEQIKKKLKGKTKDPKQDSGESNLFHILQKIPFTLLGDRIRNRREKYASLELQLKQARVPTSYEMYVSSALFYSLVTAFVGMVIGLTLTYFVFVVFGLPEQLTNVRINESFAWLLVFRDVILGAFLVIFSVVFFGGITYALFMLYPSFQAGERKNEIDQQLPYAVTFMYALSKGGMNIIEVFRSLAKSENTYGEVSKEIDTILREMDYFGHDLRTAIANVSETTPSTRMQDLLYNLLTIIDSGGDISKYFQDKSENYLQKAVVDQKGFLETLALLAESYVTAFVAGPLFIIILGVMMSVMGSGSDTMVYAIIYAVLPIGSIMFVVMISIITPGELADPELLKTRENLDHGIPEIPEHLQPAFDENGNPLEESEENIAERENYENFIKSKKNLKLKGYIKNPVKPFLENPVYSLGIFGPLGLMVMVLPLLLNIRTLNGPAEIVDFADDYIVFGAFLMILPLAIFFEIKSRRLKKLERSVPDLLKRLASTNETGMTLQESIKLIARTETDEISKEVRKVWRDIDWGLGINDGLIRFANRLRTQVVSRSFTLITKANESSGDIGEVLRVAARDAASEQDMKRERAMNMMIYIVIIYISFLVFVGVIYVISTTFLTEMARAGEQISSSGASGGFITSFNLEDYTRLFKHAALIQGLSSGLMAGAMGEGRILAGLKHSIIMMTFAYVIFTMFI
nr:type II secretion system F family protein [Methanohalophilus levihalophilus]